MRYTVNEYKASIKKVDPTFDGDYYDRLISSEPTTLALEHSVEMPEEEAERWPLNPPIQNKRMLPPSYLFN